MTNQEAFDIVAKHLLKQNRQAFKGESVGLSCMYRNEAGLKCAAGALIPDELYDPAMEGSPIQAVLSEFKDLANVLRRVDGNLLRRLQCIHDSFLPQEWRVALTKAAADFGLDASSVTARPEAQ